MKAAVVEMANARSPEKAKLVTEEQMMAAGFSDRRPVDHNAGLPRYEDVVCDTTSPSTPAMMPAAPSIPAVEAPVVHQPPLASPDNVVGMLLQQQQQLMEENRQLREQMMQFMQIMQANGGQAQPARTRVPRSDEMTQAQREKVEYSGHGLLG